MYLSERAAVFMLLGVVPVLIWPRPLTVVLWLLALMLLALLDVGLAASPYSLQAGRKVDRAVRLDETTTATLTISNQGKKVAKGLVRDAWVPSAGASNTRHRLNLGPGRRTRLHTQLRPTRRGDRVADLVTVRLAGPLGLAGRQASLQAPARLRVLPAFTSRKHLPSRLARLREMDGRSAVMVRGAGTEFDSLREYVVGDDVRSIDWRSTARRGGVVVRTWRPERDRRVLLILDTGRLACARLGDATRMDAQIEAALLLSALASHAGDRVDVVALDEELRAQVRGQSGAALMAELADSLAPVEPRLVETSWQLITQTVGTMLSQRALVVVLTAVDPGATDSEALRHLASLARKHTVLLASATDPMLGQLRQEHGQSDQTYVAAAAEHTLAQNETVRARLSRSGVEVAESEPDRLAPTVADAYLALKAAGRL
ncbi:Uncharacterized conserved protein (some members contain a von Willebrand factor type A (vWA) domain) [Actinomyces bovis]|uniref:Uncharacterized conserved protein (Some members contain a von Willebrand factor type A (VWA) domain) n=1 Tax=Actinomyces bovis TaxID=1658 RepID=A0ABY1VMJ9_9ACTO|nr:DUF58 domain-containing protein [Actinomyces bovis]SPT53328.1 Uncharacterized conserved protein (some members contain a von Willebrand factor type A (vWA) domain) [Actinomyces bovis]VEG52681.1 Uncharacterized conserved protein (some members contain a von Willebrand factor type A (vWA) domain) [Actinomyces israelii]